MIINYAHRGASKYYPENTMIAFQKAIEMGATGIEADIHMTKDGVLVIIHDEKVNRTTNGIGLVKDYTYAQLLNLDAGYYFYHKISDIKIPTLNELIEFSKANNILLNLDLKSSIFKPDNLEETLLNTIYKYNMEDSVIISSFNVNSLLKIKKLSSNINIAVSCMVSLYVGQNFCDILKTNNLNPYYKLIMEPKIIDSLKEENMKLIPYTIDRKHDLNFFIKHNVDGIITNYPNRLSKLLCKK